MITTLLIIANSSENSIMSVDVTEKNEVIGRNKAIKRFD